MIESIQTYLEKYPQETVDLFKRLRELVYESTSPAVAEKIWARLPSYYLGHAFIRFIPFKDHINIEAEAVRLHQQELCEFRITAKGMLQIFVGQKLPEEQLKQIFSETLLQSCRISE